MRRKVDICNDKKKHAYDNKTMMLSIISLFRNSLSGLMGLSFANGSALGAPIDSKKGKNQITFEGPSPLYSN